jgi:hypothetical protein
MVIDKTIDFNSLTLKRSIAPSSSPLAEELEISRKLSEMFCKKESEWLKDQGLLRVNFDIKKERRSFIIKGIFYFKEDGSSIYIPTRYKMMMEGNRYSTTLGKVSAMIPLTFVDSFHDVKKEITYGIVHEAKTLTSWTFVVSALTAIFGVDFIFLIFFMFGIAVIDGILALIFSRRYDPKIKDDEKIIIERLIFFAFLICLFIGLSFGQIGLEYVIWKNQGETLKELLTNAPEYIERVAWLLNAQTLATIGIIIYYGNRMRMAFERATGLRLNPFRKRNSRTQNIEG